MPAVTQAGTDMKPRSNGDAAAADQGALSLAVTGLMEVDALAGRVASRLHTQFPDDLINVTMVGGDGTLAVRATYGNRTMAMSSLTFPIAGGIGGLVVRERRMVAVQTYGESAATRPFIDLMVEQEGIRAAAGVPILVNNQALGVIFLGRRGEAEIPDADLDVLQDTARSVAPLVGASVQMSLAVEAARSEERNRLAIHLHDQLMPLLFAIGASVRRTRETMARPARDTLAQLSQLEELTASANALARSAMTEWGPLPRAQKLAVSLKSVCDRFTVLTGIPVSLGFVGHQRVVDAAVLETLVAVAIEALNNVAKHSPAASVAVTVTTGPDEVTMAVLDDGPGLPPTFEARSITDPSAGEHYGLANLAHRVSLLQGQFDVQNFEDGGVTVKASIPLGMP
ncbi:MAG: ATP-binding protein [Mycobacterium sp.]